MYKLYSIVLSVSFLTICGLYIYEKNAHGKTRQQYYEQVGKLEGMVQESNNLYSAAGAKISALENIIKDQVGDYDTLKKLLKSRDEEIAVVTTASLKWRDKYLKIKNASSQIIYVGNDDPNDPAVVKCEECFKDFRIKVNFEEQMDYLKVKGYTLTNPDYAELEINWVKDLKLNIILTKDGAGNFRVYLDSDNSDIVPTDLKLAVDPSVLGYKWYEKISASANLAVGKEGFLTNLSLMYDVLYNLSVGPSISMSFDENGKGTYYGVGVNWHPFRGR